LRRCLAEWVLADVAAFARDIDDEWYSIPVRDHPAWRWLWEELDMVGFGQKTVLATFKNLEI
jgi:hypothetical protein